MTPWGLFFCTVTLTKRSVYFKISFSTVKQLPVTQIGVEKQERPIKIWRHPAVWLQKDYTRIVALSLWVGVTRQASHVTMLASGPKLLLSVALFSILVNKHAHTTPWFPVPLRCSLSMWRWIICIVSRHFPKYPEIIQPIMSLLQKLSEFAKTFRSALLTRWRVFSDSAVDKKIAKSGAGVKWLFAWKDSFCLKRSTRKSSFTCSTMRRWSTHEKCTFRKIFSWEPFLWSLFLKDLLGNIGKSG